MPHIWHFSALVRPGEMIAKPIFIPSLGRVSYYYPTVLLRYSNQSHYGVDWTVWIRSVLEFKKKFYLHQQCSNAITSIWTRQFHETPYTGKSLWFYLVSWHTKVIDNKSIRLAFWRMLISPRKMDEFLELYRVAFIIGHINEGLIIFVLNRTRDCYHVLDRLSGARLIDMVLNALGMYAYGKRILLILALNSAESSLPCHPDVVRCFPQHFFFQWSKRNLQRSAKMQYSNVIFAILAQRQPPIIVFQPLPFKIFYNKLFLVVFSLYDLPKTGMPQIINYYRHENEQLTMRSTIFKVWLLYIWK